MVITVQITPDGKATEMTSEEADEQKGERIYSGASLNVPERWEHKQYRLTMIMPDTFDCDEDDMNVLATTIYRRLRSESYTPEDIIYGTVYIGNENADEVIDFTKEDLTYICKQVLKPKSKIITYRRIPYYIYIQTWTCRTLRLNHSARKKKQRSSNKSSRSSEGTTESTTTLTKRRRNASTVRRPARASAP